MFHVVQFVLLTVSCQNLDLERVLLLEEKGEEVVDVGCDGVYAF
jgi:hypothetical protein